MAIEWDVRVERAFTLEAVRSATGSVLLDLLGLDEIPAVSVAELGPTGGLGTDLAPERLATVHGPRSGEDDHVVLYLDGIDAAVWVMTLDVGFAEDEECGVRCSVTCWRDALSVVVGISATIAIARVAGRRVWDESLLLGHERINDPEVLLRTLRTYGASDLHTAARSVLAKTRVRLPSGLAE